MAYGIRGPENGVLPAPPRINLTLVAEGGAAKGVFPGKTAFKVFHPWRRLRATKWAHHLPSIGCVKARRARGPSASGFAAERGRRIPEFLRAGRGPAGRSGAGDHRF